MRNVVDDAINEFGFDDESYNFLKTIGYLDGLSSALYRLVAEGMPQHRPYDIVANEIAKFGRRWSSRHLLPPTAQRQVQRYQNSHPSALCPAHKCEKIAIHQAPKDRLQEHFRKLADKRYENKTLAFRKDTKLRPLQEPGETTTPGKAKESQRIRFHAEKIALSEIVERVDKAADTVRDQSLDENEAATKIQSVYRGRMVRQQLDHEGKYKDAIRAEIQIDNLLRNATTPSSESNTEHDTAATIIQKSWRGAAARKRIKQHNAAATKIQKHVRGRQARKKLALERNGKTEKNFTAGSEEQAACTIQKAWRKHRPMASIDENEEVTSIDDDEDVANTDCIQEYLETEPRTSAAITIQKNVRGYQTRLRYRKSIDETQL